MTRLRLLRVLANVFVDALQLLWAAHNLERFADRVTNICERTVFIVTGELTEITDTDNEFWHPRKHD